MVQIYISNFPYYNYGERMELLLSKMRSLWDDI